MLIYFFKHLLSLRFVLALRHFRGTPQYMTSLRHPDSSSGKLVFDDFLPILTRFLISFFIKIIHFYEKDDSIPYAFYRPFIIPF
jgi:hypothetical protein